jgi:hypothetical protein
MLSRGFLLDKDNGSHLGDNIVTLLDFGAKYPKDQKIQMKSLIEQREGLL